MDHLDNWETGALARLRDRRRFLRNAVAGTVVCALGAEYLLSDTLTARALADTRADGKPRLPPGQRVLDHLKPMGGQAGSPSPGAFRLKVHGEVEKPYELDFQALLGMPQKEYTVDVHCVTGWSLLDSQWTGVSLEALAARAGLKKTARHVIFEAAHGYTTNVPLKDALGPNVFVAHRYRGKSIPLAHGAPVRNILPDLYFWKSAKWLTGIRFVTRDEPGYWETRGYHNHADPWREERYG
jgi:DMSO/TMAO reductase YedYZ molybdopterin-dependent catalytic subunit